MEKPENGVTLLSIEGAHTIDFAIAVLGGWSICVAGIYAALRKTPTFVIRSVGLDQDERTHLKRIEVL